MSRPWAADDGRQGVPLAPVERADHSVSVVVPVYQGEKTLPALMREIEALATPRLTPGGHSFAVTEVLLVHDNGPDDSASVLRRLEGEYDFVRAIWLSKNFGQHAATLAGMASTGGDWVVTLDEDGQHDPAYIADMLDVAMADQASVVYARPTNAPSHGFLRNTASRGAKWILNQLSSANASQYQSYRFLLGSVARSVAAYAGSGVYLDLALGWVAKGASQCDVRLRDEGDRTSGYSARRLFSHFWRMVLSSGTRGLRVVSAIGVLFFVLAIVVTIVIFIGRFTQNDVPEGWASTIVAVLVSSGAILFSLGIIAEYIGVAVSTAQGRPPYLIVRDPHDGPLGRPPYRP